MRGLKILKINTCEIWSLEIPENESKSGTGNNRQGLNITPHIPIHCEGTVDKIINSMANDLQCVEHTCKNLLLH